MKNSNCSILSGKVEKCDIAYTKSVNWFKAKNVVTFFTTESNWEVQFNHLKSVYK